MAELATLSGTATYQERMALPPGAVLEVELLDISRADVAAERLTSIRLRPRGELPIPFTLSYDPSLIEQTHTYAVSAKIILDNRILFRSDTVHPVLTRGAGNTVDVTMIQTASRQSGHRSPSHPPPAVASSGDAASLIGPIWIAEEIMGQRVVDNLQSTLTLAADGQTSGSGGCNRFHGSYSLEEETLIFGQLASTSRACLPAIDEQESRFYQALVETRAYRMDNGLLVLMDAQGSPVMRLGHQNDRLDQMR